MKEGHFVNNEEYEQLINATRTTGKAIGATVDTARKTGKTAVGVMKWLKRIVITIMSFIISTFGIAIIVAIATVGLILNILVGYVSTEEDTSIVENEIPILASMSNEILKTPNTTLEMMIPSINFKLYPNVSPQTRVPNDWSTLYVGTLMLACDTDLENVRWDINCRNWYVSLWNNAEITIIDGNVHPNVGDILFYEDNGKKVGIVLEVKNNYKNYIYEVATVLSNNRGDMVVTKTTVYSDYAQRGKGGFYEFNRTDESIFNVRKEAPKYSNTRYSTGNYFNDNEAQRMFDDNKNLIGGNSAYVWGRCYEVYGNFFITHTGLPVRKPSGQWYDYSTKDKGSLARAGSVGVWRKGNTGGFVAFVENVKNNGDIMISYSIRSNDEKKQFVYKKLEKKNGTYPVDGYEFEGFIYIGGKE